MIQHRYFLRVCLFLLVIVVVIASIHTAWLDFGLYGLATSSVLMCSSATLLVLNCVRHKKPRAIAASISVFLIISVAILRADIALEGWSTLGILAQKQRLIRRVMNEWKEMKHRNREYSGLEVTCHNNIKGVVVEVEGDVSDRLTLQLFQGELLRRCPHLNWYQFEWNVTFVHGTIEPAAEKTSGQSDAP